MAVDWTQSNRNNQNMFDSISEQGKNNNILLIEDNPGDARLVEILLYESDLLNCEVTNKTTLASGIEELEQNTDYAAILLDLTLPDSSGFETLETLVTRFPHQNIIVLTGLSDKSMGISAVKAGAQDFLVKGAFDSDSLAKSLRYSIERNSVLSRLEETQRLAGIGNWECNPKKNSFSASDEVYRIFDLVPRKTVFSYADITDLTCPFSVFDELHQETNGEEVLKKDIKIRTATGEMKFVYIQCKRIIDNEENEIYSGIIQDITERKQTEEEMVKSQRRYQTLFSQSRDAIFITSAEGKMIDFNFSTTNLTGFSDKELQQMHNVFAIFHPIEKRKTLLSLLQNQQGIKDFEIDLKCKDGQMRSCLITSNIAVTDGRRQYNSTLRDITERRVAEELRKSRDLARQSAKMKEQFIASISHEMRTPMNAILGMSNLMIQTELSEEQNGYVSSIKKSSEILLGIVNDILEISTIQNGKVLFENDNFDLHDLMKNLINVMQYKAIEKDLYLELDVKENVPVMIQGDKLRLNQILYNLVGNAVKFTDVGYVKITVENISNIADKVRLKFSVEDTGIGIPKDKVEAIFETFTRIRQKDRIYEGTGLGLSIAKNLVDQQNGCMEVTSEFGKGSTFAFELEFTDGTNIIVSSNLEEDEVIIDPELSINLLLVEDHKINQLVATRTLEKQWKNINITIANNGKEAIEHLEQQVFDIILMDIQMPIMDGYEATDYIRKNMPQTIASLPILAMTAHAHISKDEKFKEYGMDDYVLKPFEPAQLFKKITIYTQKK